MKNFFKYFKIEEKHIGTEIVTIGSVDHTDDDIFNICSFAPRQIISNSLCCQNSLQLSLSVGDIVQVKGFVRYVADVIGIYATEITKIKPEDALKRGTLLEPKPVYNEDSVENIDENSDEDNQDKEPFFVEDNLNNLKFGSQTEFIAFLKKKAYDAGFQFSTTRGTKRTSYVKLLCHQHSEHGKNPNLNTGCKFYVSISQILNSHGVDLVWHVSSFNLEHNHDLKLERYITNKLTEQQKQLIG